MLVLLLALFYAQVWLYLFQLGSNRDVRDALLKSALLLASLIAFGTEALSAFTALNAQNVLVFWIAANLGFMLFLSLRCEFSLERAVSEVREAVRHFAAAAEDRAALAYLLIAGSMLAAILLSALYAPPNTPDSMVYHMARVAHWIQQGSVEHYPTAVLRQLYQNPFAEYAILHLQLLAGNDRYANLVQFSSLLGCGVAVSLICKEFGLDRKTQALSLLLAITTPMAIVQASGTKNDLVVSMFTLSFFLFYLKFASSGDKSICIYAGLSLGIALLSKGTAYPFCLAVAAVVFATFFFSRTSTKDKSQFFFRSAVIGAIALLFVGPMLTRNFNTFGSPFTSGEDKVANARISPTIVAANLYRNYAMHLGSLYEPMNEFLEDSGDRLFGSELNDPDATYLNTPFDASFSFSEDDTGNFLHILLITLSLPFAFFSRQAREQKYLAANGLVVILGFVIYCLVLRWQPWAARLHLPIFILGVPLIAAALSRAGIRTTAFSVLFCVCGSLPYLLFGEPRSIMSDNSVLITDRSDQYFANKKDIAAAYVEAAEILKSEEVSEIGLRLSMSEGVAGKDDWEYPLWVLLKNDFTARPHIRYIGVKNVSSKLGDEELPDWVISKNQESTIGGVSYTEVWASSSLRILRKSPPLANHKHAF